MGFECMTCFVFTLEYVLRVYAVVLDPHYRPVDPDGEGDPANIAQSDAKPGTRSRPKDSICRWIWRESIRPRLKYCSTAMALVDLVVNLVFYVDIYGWVYN